MIDAYQLRLEVVRPALKYLDPVIPYSIDAENLLLGTCAQESRMGTFIKQLGNGPAQGIFQMEPATHDDIWANFLEYRPELAKLAMMCDRSGFGNPLVTNLLYAAVMTRIHYYRVSEPLPDSSVKLDMADYWKCYYNTSCGKGGAQEFVDNYIRHVA